MSLHGQCLCLVRDAGQLGGAGVQGEQPGGRRAVDQVQQHNTSQHFLLNFLTAKRFLMAIVLTIISYKQKLLHSWFDAKASC